MCQALGIVKAASVADHIKPHKGDEVLFWQGELQSVCLHHHDGACQQMENGSWHDANAPKYWQEIALLKRPILPPLYNLDGWPVEQTKSEVTKYGVPYWFEPFKIPVIIICGAPASGKSTYAQKFMQDGWLLIDTDAIADDMGLGRKNQHGKPLTREEWQRVINARDKCLRALQHESAKRKYKGAILIATMARREERQHWYNVTKPQKIIVLETPSEICQARLRQDRAQGVIRSSESHDAIFKWWLNYTPRDGDIVVKYNQN